MGAGILSLQRAGGQKAGRREPECEDVAPPWVERSIREGFPREMTSKVGPLISLWRRRQGEA